MTQAGADPPHLDEKQHYRALPVPHIIAGSVEAVFGVFSGHTTVGDDVLRFLTPTLIGNVFGGTALAAPLNHASVANEPKE